MKSRRCSRSNVKRQRLGDEGVALIMMLLLLTLLSALSIAMVVSYSSDTLVNGYYRSSRAAFYAADGGNTIVRQDIWNRLHNLLPATLPIGTYPLPANTSSIVTAINSAYGSWVPINSSGSSAESFKLYTANTSLTLYECDVSYYTDSTLTTKAGPDRAIAANLTSSTTCPVHTYAFDYTYTYHYNLTTVGMVRGTGGTAITDSGNIVVSATSEDTVSSFSQYGTFIDKMTICSATLIGGTITGRQFTNGNWTFGSSQTYTFTGSVGSAGCTTNPCTLDANGNPSPQNSNAGYIFSDGTCKQVAAPSATYNKTTISPTFQKGLQLGQKYIQLPTNEYNQRSAVITGTGITTNGTTASDPTTAQLSAALKDSSGNYSYTASTTSGVFVPVDPASGSPGTIKGGGIWVEGTADSVTLSYSGSTSQVYTIKQGATTTTVTITPGSTPGTGTTVVKKGTNPSVTYNGVPTQTDPSTGSVANGVVLYVDGNITSLSGTVQDNTGVNITAANDITITSNLVYKTAVVDSNGNPTSAASAGTATQTLGLYTAGGSVYLNPSGNNANIEVDASILTTKDNGKDCNYGDTTCDGVLGVTYGANIGTLTIVGGRVQSRSMIMPTGTIDKRNVFFDQRYNGTFAPPFFPRPNVIINPPGYQVTIQRSGWVLQTAY